MKVLRLAGAGAAAAVVAGASGLAWAADRLGQPTPGAFDLQPGASILRHQAMGFHNYLLMPIITIISLFVLALLIYVVLKFNKKANPVPATWSHNTVVEVAWTVIPVVILAIIAIFSFKLLYAYHDMPKPDVTVKVTGYQWYWSYEYPDQKIAEYTSVLVPKEKSSPELYPLTADQPMVVPQGKVVRILLTGADVIHAWGVPSLGVMIDAIPGRVNQQWFRAEKTGMFYGQCRELCGLDHAFMPINVKVVTQPRSPTPPRSARHRRAGPSRRPTPTR
jgi:cytochrome c oxidase subunit 2